MLAGIARGASGIPSGKYMLLQGNWSLCISVGERKVCKDLVACPSLAPPG